MKEDKKPSILKEALTDYNQIVEAANVNAKIKLAEEFPERLNDLLKEELKNKNKSAKPSYKKIEDEAEKNEEPVMKNQKKETVKVVKEVVGDSKPFSKTKKLQTEEFDITELDISSVGSALENADEDDEVLTMDEIESEIANMENLGGELEDMESDSEEGFEGGEEEVETEENGGDALAELISMRDNLDSIIKSMGGETEGEESFEDSEEIEDMDETYDEENTEDEFSMDSDNAEYQETGDDYDTEQYYSENEEMGDDSPITDDDIDAVLGNGVTEGLFDGNKPKNLSPIDSAMWDKFPIIAKQGALLQAVKRTPENIKRDILNQAKQFGGSIRQNTDGTVRYISKEEQGKRQSSATAPNVSSKSIGSGGTMEEGLFDGNKPNNLSPIDSAMWDKFPIIAKQGALLKAVKRTPEDIKRQILAQAKQSGGSIRQNTDGTVRYISKEEQAKRQSSATAPVVTGQGGMSSNPIAEQEIEEAHGVTYGNRRNSVGRHTPNASYLSKGELDQAPSAIQEANKKITKLIEENKKLIKKVNETKSYKTSVTSLVENYKNALEKYRTQLKEMAIFNTNLANVNNILVNEELALTQEDKINIINEFKKVNTIAESQNKYKSVLTEMKTNRKTIKESVEAKVSTSIQSSSNLIVEKTAYESEDVKKMKRLIEFAEKKGKKLIK